MSAHVLLNLFNELKKSNKMEGLPSILSFFHDMFDKFINTGVQRTNLRFCLNYFEISFSE